jgi:predicted negative regulator of RcsB-dependent stress response
MEFFEKNIKNLMVGFVGLIVIGMIWAFLANRTKNQETAAQEKFAAIETQYGKYKEDLAKSEQISNMPKNAKDASKTTPEEKKVEADLAASLIVVKPKLVSDLTQFVDENSKAIAGSMAALYLSELLLTDKKATEALAVLRKVENTSKDLTSILVQKKIGALLADNNQCDEALKVWDKILKINTAKFAHAEVKIMQSLCYQKNNDLAKAEEILNSIKNDKTEVSAEYVQHAEKILRLIHFKKASGT